jgi:leader peptidase (prepilin peptidase)/N-methyltransferase
MSASPPSKSTWAQSLERIGRDRASPGLATTLLLGMTGAAGVFLSMANAPGTIGVLGATLMLVTMTIAIIDWGHFVIPDWLNATGFALAMVHAAAQEPEAVIEAVALAAIRGGAVMLVFLALRYVYARVRGRQGLGLGDVKLAAVAGAWLDWLVVPIAVELAAFAALSVYVLRRLVVRQPLSATHRLPFGLFFAPAIWMCWLLEAVLTAW